MTKLSRQPWKGWVWAGKAPRGGGSVVLEVVVEEMEVFQEQQSAPSRARPAHVAPRTRVRSAFLCFVLM